MSGDKTPERLPKHSAERLGMVFFPAFDWAISPTHPEREERLLYTLDQLSEEGVFDLPGIRLHNAELASEADVERVHFCLPDLPSVCTAAHLASAGGAMEAARLVLEGVSRRAFALVRPPGHHAMRVVHGCRGFCNINIEAVMLSYARRRFGIKRVAVVDTDCHHGDGSQDIFWHDPDTLFISIHQDGRTLYPGTGFSDEAGGPGALGRTINIPLPPGSGDAELIYTLEHVVLPLLDDFKPDLIVNSAGQDNHYSDPITNMAVTARGYADLTAMLRPDIVVLEGGYAIHGALPYVNLGIALALAGEDYSRVREPEPFFPGSISGIYGHTVSDHVKRRAEAARAIYFNPPEKPAEGEFVLEGGLKLFARERAIYYDTDDIMETQREKIIVCENCPGALFIESATRRGPGFFCIYLPMLACPTCRNEAMARKRKAEKTGRYARVVLQDMAC